MESFESWLDREFDYAAGAMLKSVSRTDLVKSRPGFGHEIRPRAGSIIASPVLASWDPDPDYFFHWFRDSAVVIDALRLLHEAGRIGAEALTHLHDFVHFSRSLRTLDGKTLVSEPAWRTKVIEEFAKYCRDDAELALIQGDAVIADTRVNPDGTIDISRWARPQHDGPPLRALAVLRWGRSTTLDGEAADLILTDLAFTLNHWRKPSYDIWEEESGQHYYTLCVSAAALSEGAEWLAARGDAVQADAFRAASEEIRRVLDELWSPEDDNYRSRVLASGERSKKELDIAVILAAIHANAEPQTSAATAEAPAKARASGSRYVASAASSTSAREPRAHGPHDPRMLATLARLEALFDAEYPINHGRPPGRGIAMGRYAGDTYFSGGAYYFSTLGAAELCFRAAAGREDALTWVTKGDAFLATVRAFTPPGGELSEQFDRRTGSQTSAKHLAWSYAAFISCVTARRAVMKSRR
jgi:glucoamylase